MDDTHSATSHPEIQTRASCSILHKHRTCTAVRQSPTVGCHSWFVGPTSDRALEGKENRKRKVLRARHSTVSAVGQARTALHTRRKEPSSAQTCSCPPFLPLWLINLVLLLFISFIAAGAFPAPSPGLMSLPLAALLQGDMCHAALVCLSLGHSIIPTQTTSHWPLPGDIHTGSYCNLSFQSPLIAFVQINSS